MAKDLYLAAYENAGMDVIKTSIDHLLDGKMSKYGASHDYTDEQVAVCVALAPHLGGLFVDIWNTHETPRHDILNAHEGQLHGYDTSVIVAETMHAIPSSDLSFIVEKPNEAESEEKTALYFTAIVEKIKNDMCEIIKITSHGKREAMRKFTPKAPEYKHETQKPKPAGPKPPGYETDPESIFQ